MPATPFRRVVVAAAALLLALEIAPGAAAAQPSNSPLNTPTGAGAAAPAPAPVEGASGSYKSPGTALALSLGGTVASLGLVAAAGASENSTLSTVGSIGFWVAPSFGHWYVGKGWTTGLKYRLAGAGAATLGLMWFAVDCIPGCNNDFHPALFVAIGGGVSFVGGMVHDIATAPGAARAHNARIDAGRIQDVTVRPSFGNGHAGLALGGRF